MSYTIILGTHHKADVEAHLDAPRPTAIPAHVSFGVGDKQKRYNDWLDKCFTENKALLNFLAYIHKAGKEKGSISLVAAGKQRMIIMQGVKQFLTKHEQVLDTLLPYIFDDVTQVHDKKVLIEQHIQSAKMNEVQLHLESDVETINEVIINKDN